MDLMSCLNASISENLCFLPTSTNPQTHTHTHTHTHSDFRNAELTQITTPTSSDLINGPERIIVVPSLLFSPVAFYSLMKFFRCFGLNEIWIATAFFLMTL